MTLLAQPRAGGILLVMAGTPKHIEEAIEDHRFDEALVLADAEPEPDRSAMRLHVETSRAEILESAHQLASWISAAARQHEYSVLLDFDEDPSTAGLLSLLPASTEQRARLHLSGARHWAERQLESNRRRLDEAQQALEDLDLGLARSIIRRLEERFLGDPERQRRDALLLDLSARSMEAEELAEAAALIVAEEQPESRRWWRRRRP